MKILFVFTLVCIWLPVLVVGWRLWSASFPRLSINSAWEAAAKEVERAAAEQKELASLVHEEGK